MWMKKQRGERGRNNHLYLFSDKSLKVYEFTKKKITSI